MKSAVRAAILLCLALFLAALPCLLPAESFASETAETPAPKMKTLKSGSSGEEVIRLQNRLSELGYFTLQADGQFGSDTKAAVKLFQSANGLKADGIAGSKTLTLLYSEEALAAPRPVDVLAGSLPMLVNKEHPVPETFVPEDLVTLKDVCDPALVKIKYPKLQAVRTAVDALITMLEAAREDGITNWQISAAYRSYQNQVSTLNAKINTYLERNSDWTKGRARSAALKTVAEPGCSEHHLGLAFDINVPKTSAFINTKQCAWLHEHCWDYGFIVRYQEGKEKITGFSPEAWHIRYVGTEHSRIIRDNNWCLEEYLQAVEASSPDELITEVSAAKTSAEDGFMVEDSDQEDSVQEDSVQSEDSLIVDTVDESDDDSIWDYLEDYQELPDDGEVYADDEF